MKEIEIERKIVDKGSRKQMAAIDLKSGNVYPVKVRRRLNSKILKISTWNTRILN